MVGKKFNRLTVIRYFDTNKKYRMKRYECLCKCGKTKIVYGKNLRNNRTQSCGCLQKEKVSRWCKENNYKKKITKIENFVKSGYQNFFINPKDIFDLDDCYFIYKLTNLINKKIYIGKTTTSLKKLLRRYRRYGGNSKWAKLLNNKRYINRAINKYGLNNFLFEIIDHVNSKKKLDKLEIYYINVFQSRNRQKGYNLTQGGEGTSGYLWSQESKTKLSEICKKKFKDGYVNPMQGKHLSKEAIQKVIESNKKRGKTKRKLFYAQKISKYSNNSFN